MQKKHVFIEKRLIILCFWSFLICYHWNPTMQSLTKFVVYIQKCIQRHIIFPLQPNCIWYMQFHQSKIVINEFQKYQFSFLLFKKKLKNNKSKCISPLCNEVVITILVKERVEKMNAIYNQWISTVFTWKT